MFESELSESLRELCEYWAFRKEDEGYNNAAFQIIIDLEELLISNHKTYSSFSDTVDALNSIQNILYEKADNKERNKHNFVMLMLILKTIRYSANPTNKDHLLDIAGYAVLQMIKLKEDAKRLNEAEQNESLF